MGTKVSAPPPPDYSGIASAQKQLGKEALALQREQYAWAKEAYAKDSEITDKVVASYLETQDQAKAWAEADRARYEEIFQPLEDDLAKEAQEYGSPERKDQEIGRAQAAVAQQFQGAREAAQRNLESYGIRPDSTRYGALDIGIRAQEAAAKAAAGNQTSQAVDATARALRSEAINVGRGYPGQVIGMAQLGNNSGAGAVNSALAQTASGANTMGTGAQWSGIANNAYSGAANTMNMGYQNQMAATKFNSEQTSGIGAIAGIAAGLGAQAFLGGTKPWSFAEDGGMIEEPGAAPGGGAVPAETSPTKGAIPDDVSAKLTPGEFVVPKETVEWYGLKHMHGMINKAREDKAKTVKQSGAIPDVRMAPAAPANFRSRGALPVAA